MKIKTFAINNSLINEWIACPRRAHLSYIQSLEPKSDEIPANKIGMHLGTCVHRVIEAYYRDEDVREAIDKAHAELRLPEEGRGCIAHVDRIMEEYINGASIGTAKPFLIEGVMELPLNDDGLSFRGTLDLVVEEEDGSLTLVDHKTTSNLYYLKPRIPFSYQFTGYLELLRRNYPDRVINNTVIVHALQSSLKTVKFKQYETVRTQWDIDQWYDWVTYWGELIKDTLANDKDIVANMGDACTAYGHICPFASLCLNPGEDATETLSNMNKKEGYTGFIIK